MKTVELRKVVEILGDDVLRVIGPVDRSITRPAPIDEAPSESTLTFCSKPSSTAEETIRSTKSGVVLCAENPFLNKMADLGKTLVVVENPRLSFLRIVQALFAESPPRGKHPTAVVHAEARIHPDTYIGPFTYIGDCEVGAGTIVHGHVHIHSGTRIGRNVIIHAGAVIGGDGFGYERNKKGELERFPHIGGVVIEDNVEVGACTCIDRGTLKDTIIREGAKIDNLVHIAHNVVIGRRALVIAHAMIGGSTRIGDNAWVAPCACLRDNISVGEKATVGLGALVVEDVTNDVTVMGCPARPAAEYKKILKAMKKIAGVK